MASVYVNNIVISSGSDFTQTFDLEGSDTNSPANLTGFDAYSQMKKHAGSSTAVNFTTSIFSPATLGRLSINLTSSETSTLKPGRYLYDIVIQRAGVKTRVIEGMVLVK